MWTDQNHDPVESLTFGEQREWAFNVPSMYQALAAPEIENRLVRRPASQPTLYGTDHQEHITARGYWFSLLHLLYFNFGWLQPGIGLETWLRSIDEFSDKRLDLIKEVWLADGYLDQVIEWLKKSPNSNVLTHFASKNFLSKLAPNHQGERNVALESALEVMKIPNPLTGGGDALHLSSHLEFSAIATKDVAADASLTTSTSSEPRAVLTVNYMRGFYEHLHKLGNELGEHSSGRSWRIEVVVKSVGYLGTFRRSRETGLWFVGPHSLHMMGNPQKSRA